MLLYIGLKLQHDVILSFLHYFPVIYDVKFAWFDHPVVWSNEPKQLLHSKKKTKITKYRSQSILNRENYYISLPNLVQDQQTK